MLSYHRDGNWKSQEAMVQGSESELNRFKVHPV